MAITTTQLTNPQPVEPIDMLDILGILSRRKDTYLSFLLDDLEILYRKNPNPPYQDVRRLILDYFNDYYRSFVKAVVGGEVEG